MPGREVEPQRVGIDADADLDQLQRALVAQPAQRGDVFRPHVGLRHQVDRAGLQAQDLGVLVALTNSIDQPIEVRQRRRRRRPSCQ